MNFKLITLIAIGCFLIAFADLWNLDHYQNWHKSLHWWGAIALGGFVVSLITLVFVPLFRKRK